MRSPETSHSSTESQVSIEKTYVALCEEIEDLLVKVNKPYLGIDLAEEHPGAGDHHSTSNDFFYAFRDLSPEALASMVIKANDLLNKWEILHARSDEFRQLDNNINLIPPLHETEALLRRVHEEIDRLLEKKEFAQMPSLQKNANPNH
jgi:hypothetical protein